MAASVPKRVFSLVTSLTARAGPYMYLRYADKYFGLLASRLRGVYQPVISTPNPFLGPHPHPLASICAYGAPQHHDHQISAVC
jgi:hypothetical protein